MAWHSLCVTKGADWSVLRLAGMVLKVQVNETDLFDVCDKLD